MLLVGTDCAGMEAPLEALRQIGCMYRHVFSSEIDPNADALIRANHSPNIQYGDITLRDPKTTPYVDLYVAGFPCQPYSTMRMGQNLPADDRRKAPLWSIVSYIRAQRPVMFVLENVRAFRGTAEFERLMSPTGGEHSLIDGMGDYQVAYACLTPRAHGSPHSRPRLFIVGRRDSRPVVFPAPVPLTKTVMDLVDEELIDADVPALAECYRRTIDGWGIPWDTRGVLEIKACMRQFKYRNAAAPGEPIRQEDISKVVRVDVSPCLLASSPGLILVHRGRYLTIEEHQALQGFRHTHFPACLCFRNCVRLLGNSINVPTLAALLAANLEGTPLWTEVSEDAAFDAVWRPVSSEPIVRRRASHTAVKIELPPGWRVETRTRQSGKYMGGTYSLYNSPRGTRFRSLAEVSRAYPQLLLPAD